MKTFVLIFIVILTTGLLCCCVGQKNQEIEYDKTIKAQEIEMTALYNEYIDVLNNIKDILYKEKNIRDISSDGYFIFEDGSKKWVDDISSRIKSIYSIDTKGYQTIGLHGGSDDKGRIFLYIETYYDECQRMYNIKYSEIDLTKEDNWYTKLGDNWYLWGAGMT